MKGIKRVLALAAAFCAVTLSGCASYHVLQLDNGREASDDVTEDTEDQLPVTADGAENSAEEVEEEQNGASDRVDGGAESDTTDGDATDGENGGQSTEKTVFCNVDFSGYATETVFSESNGDLFDGVLKLCGTQAGWTALLLPRNQTISAQCLYMDGDLYFSVCVGESATLSVYYVTLTPYGAAEALLYGYEGETLSQTEENAEYSVATAELEAGEYTFGFSAEVGVFRIEISGTF